MAEIRDGTVKEVLEELRRLSYDIEEINEDMDTVDRTGDTLEDLRARVYHHENEMTNLKRQVKRGSAPLPSQNQQAGTDRFPIPMYSGERSSLSRFLKLFYAWALSHKTEDALSYGRPLIMTSNKSRSELEIEYGRRDVEQSLVVWSALTKTVEKDKTIADIVVEAKAPLETWKLLNSMVEDDSSDRARELAKKQFKELSMNDGESMKEYIARAKSVALNVNYHDIEISEQEISRRVLNDLPPSYAPEKRNFALKTYFSLAELVVSFAWRSSTGAWTGTTAATPWPLASKPEVAGEARDVEATMAVDVASAMVKVARRINGSRHQPRYQREQQPTHQPQQQQCQPQRQREQ